MNTLASVIYFSGWTGTNDPAVARAALGITQCGHAEALASAIVGHLVGDYLLQNDWMALNKKRNGLICMLHCLLWTLSVMVFSGWLGAESAFVFSILLSTHFIQDHTNIVPWFMRSIGQERFMMPDRIEGREVEHEGKMGTEIRVVPGLGPWSVIVVDNIFHILTIWLVWRFLV